MNFPRLTISLLSSGALALTAAGALVSQALRDPGISRRGNTTVIQSANGFVEVTPVSADVFRIATAPGADSRISLPTQAQAQPDNPDGVDTHIFKDSVVFASPTTRVVVNRTTGRVTFFGSDGRMLLNETEGINNSGSVKTVTFTSGPGEDFYGAGERGHSLRLNGDSLGMYNRQNYGYTGSDPRISMMNITVPYFASSKGYGVLFDDYTRSALELRDTIRYTTHSRRPIAYYFINGNGTLAGTTSRYTTLTGLQPLPPLWALGYITSRYGYHTEKEARQALDSIKAMSLPLDAMVFDLYWYGKETDMGRLEWNRAQWPDPKKLLSDFSKEGVNIVLISQPYINKIGALDNYNMLDSLGMLVKDADGHTKDVTTWVGDAGMFDVSNPDTREWLWNRYKTLTDDGVAAWWGDLGEPEVHPLGMVHANGDTTEEYHNVYGNEWSRILADGYSRDYPDTRLMLLMRGGTAGLQRYGVMPWSTDVSRSWGGLEPQVKIMLNSGLSGLGYMSSDIGGFAIDHNNPTDPELYVRWLQMGTFSPVLRTHAQYFAEPYNYPEQKETISRFIRMRYEWLPYNYTLAYENAALGLPLARTLDFSSDSPDPKLADIPDEYMWGDEVLVAPVLRKGERSRKVWFPRGEWYSWNNPRLRYTSQKTPVTVKAPLNELPLFIKAGSFIPQYTRPVKNTADYNPAFLTVKYFPAKEWSKYTLYDDDRKSPDALRDGAYKLINFRGSRQGSETYIELDAEGKGYQGTPQTRMMTFEIIDADCPKTVTAEGIPGLSSPLERFISPKAIRQYGWAYDKKSRTLYITIAWGNQPMKLIVK